MEKSQEELQKLKESWSGDPCWDLETTEGFEDFQEELLSFRLTKEAQWRAEEEKELNEFASAAGMPGNLLFGNCIRTLMEKIEALETQVELLRNGSRK